jgi:hypothetical protein
MIARWPLALALACALAAPALAQERKGLAQAVDPEAPLGDGSSQKDAKQASAPPARLQAAPPKGSDEELLRALGAGDNGEGLPPPRREGAGAPAAAPSLAAVEPSPAPASSTPISETPAATEEPRKGPPIVVFDPASWGHVYNDSAISDAAKSANKTKASSVEHSFSLPTDPQKLAAAIDGAEVVIIHAHGSPDGPSDAGWIDHDRLTVDKIAQAKPYLKTPPKVVILLSCENAKAPEGKKSPAQAFYDLGVGQVYASPDYMNDNKMTHYATKFLETYAATSDVEQAKAQAYEDASSAKGDTSVALPDLVRNDGP